jgi:vitamin B12 transporter
MSSKLLWRLGHHQLLLGTDLERGEAQTELTASGSYFHASNDRERWAIFGTDAIVFGPVSVTPGIRYDYTDTNADFISPSLGVTYSFSSHTVSRVSIARGFSIPDFDATFYPTSSAGTVDRGVEKVWSYQGGMETAAFRFCWLKGSLFLHEISDLHSVRYPGKSRLQGVEVEMKTVPYYDFSLLLGFFFVEAEHKETGETLHGVPRYTYDVSLRYDNEQIIRASFTGHYIRWNGFNFDGGHDTAMLWDFNLKRRLFTLGRSAADAYALGHNIFNGSQYKYDFAPNPRRWFEGGLSFSF